MTWRPSARWKSDAKNGWLGRVPPPRPGLPAQPLHTGVRVDIREAVLCSRNALEVWHAHQAAGGAPLYSGGVLDAWPAWVVEMLKVAHGEVAAIKAFLAWEATGGGNG